MAQHIGEPNCKCITDSTHMEPVSNLTNVQSLMPNLLLPMLECMQPGLSPRQSPCLCFPYPRSPHPHFFTLLRCFPCPHHSTCLIPHMRTILTISIPICLNLCISPICLNLYIPSLRDQLHIIPHSFS